MSSSGSDDSLITFLLSGSEAHNSLDAVAFGSVFSELANFQVLLHYAVTWSGFVSLKMQ